jgi:hypothetical protein
MPLLCDSEFAIGLANDAITKKVKKHRPTLSLDPRPHQTGPIYHAASILSDRILAD